MAVNCDAWTLSYSSIFRGHAQFRRREKNIRSQSRALWRCEGAQYRTIILIRLPMNYLTSWFRLRRTQDRRSATDYRADQSIYIANARVAHTCFMLYVALIAPIATNRVNNKYDNSPSYLMPPINETIRSRVRESIIHSPSSRFLSALETLFFFSFFLFSFFLSIAANVVSAPCKRREGYRDDRPARIPRRYFLSREVTERRNTRARARTRYE